MSNNLKLTIRFYPGRDDDLIAWLEEMRTSYGKKGETVKDVLRKGLGATGGGSTVPLDTGNLLAEIRQVVEATFASFAFQPAKQLEAKPHDDDLVEERLSRLDLGFSLDPPTPQKKGWGEL